MRMAISEFKLVGRMQGDTTDFEAIVSRSDGPTFGKMESGWLVNSYAHHTMSSPLKPQ